jgi:transcriptional antiterminator NusG
MVTTVSGKEEIVIESLKNRIISERLDDIMEDFKVALIPVRTKTGKEKTKNLFPGYIFIKMEMTNDA